MNSTLVERSLPRRVRPASYYRHDSQIRGVSKSIVATTLATLTQLGPRGYAGVELLYLAASWRAVAWQ
jgi:hypothetical protein